MKKVILGVVIIATLSITSFASAINPFGEGVIMMEKATKKISFGVRGNCGMCKKTIEKAALSVEGVKTANWDREKKKIDVSFDDSKTNEMAIQNAVAASGYDTDKVAGIEDAYNKLPGCCQYDHEMEMNQSGEAK